MEEMKVKVMEGQWVQDGDTAKNAINNYFTKKPNLHNKWIYSHKINNKL